MSNAVLRRSGVVADVVVSLSHADLELRIGGDVKAVSCGGSLPRIAAIELVLASAAHALHDFSGRSTESQCGGQYHAYGLLGAIGQGEAVADALAVKVNIGLGGQGNAGEMLGSHGLRAVAEFGSKLGILGYLRRPWGFAKRI